MKKKTVLNILLILFILSFFVTPLGHYAKIGLNRLFAFSPDIEEVLAEDAIDYDWRLKDPEWNIFNFEQSKGKVVFVNFWASWVLPCEAELYSIEKLYKKYGDQVDFYIITNEERGPVEAFMKEKKFDFPVTYLIIGDKMPFDATIVPSSYIIDKNGKVVVQQPKIADWNTSKVHQLLDELLKS
ncbi:MAG: TlpA family protein disulfide reductase [Flavobacteriaceae bacterium]|nr:TlpA family protein disulfide reductase [Flavobacteriaceae bacterium]